MTATPDDCQRLRWITDELETLIGVLSAGTEKTNLQTKHGELRRALERANLIEPITHASRPRTPGYEV